MQNFNDQEKEILIKFIESLNHPKTGDDYTEVEKNFIIQYSYFVRYNENMSYFVCPFKKMYDEGIYDLNVIYSEKMHVRIKSLRTSNEFLLVDNYNMDFVVNDDIFDLLNCKKKIYIKSRDLYPTFEEKKYMGRVYTLNGYTWWNHVVMK
jgi:hypothetical protein